MRAALFLALFASCQIVGGQQQALAATAPLTVESFGATCDGVTDDSAALQAALNYCRVQAGCDLTIGECTLRLAAGTSVTFGTEASSMRLRGVAGSRSRILVDGSAATIPIQIIQGQSSAAFVELSDLVFIRPWVNTFGDQAIRSKHVVHLYSIAQSSITLRRVQFFGMTSALDMLRLQGGNALVEDCGFWGVRGGKQSQSANILFDRNLMAAARRLVFHDYGLLDGRTYSADGAAKAAILATPFLPNTSYPMSRGHLLVEQVQFDEGAGDSQVHINEFGNPVGRFAFATIRNIESNAPGYAGAQVVRASKVDRLSITDVGVRWATSTQSAIVLNGVLRAELERIQVDDTRPASNHLKIDDPLYPFLGTSGRIRVRNSNFVAVDAPAGHPLELVLEP